MERHAADVVFTANRVGSCIDEGLNNVECHIYVIAYNVKWRSPIIIINSTGSIRKIFEKASNYFLGDSFIAARSMEE
eukprot:scaffold653_cov132-Skeletonema_marinoi.AAC.4